MLYASATGILQISSRPAELVSAKTINVLGPVSLPLRCFREFVQLGELEIQFDMRDVACFGSSTARPWNY